MTTCFLFAEHLDDENCLSLRLDNAGQVDAPLMLRTIDEIRDLQINSRTIVVLSATHSVFYEIELPKLSAKKIRAAIPYALEEKLTQDVLQLHFAFDHKHYHNNHYLVVVTEQEWLLEVIALLQKVNLVFDAITYDWFALNAQEACIYESHVLINDGVFKGALSSDLLALYVPEEQTQKIVFQDSSQLSNFVADLKYDEYGSVWIAKRLLQHNPMNLCQGDLWRMCRRSSANKKWYYLCGGLLLIYFISILGGQIWKWRELKHQIAVVEKEIASIYHEYFPHATNIINPKLQLSQFAHQQQGYNNTLWRILGALTKAVSMPSKIETLVFNSSHLIATVSCANFSDLDQLSAKLKVLNLHVVQTGAAVSGDHVIATLELTI